MIGKTKEKREVQYLRKKGLSYCEILKKVPVSKSSVSLWCQDIQLNNKQKKRLVKKKQENLKNLNQINSGPKAIALKRKREIDKIKSAAKKEIGPLSPYKLKIVGAMLYQAEGGKSNGVSITNSDPKLINFIIKQLKETCNISSDKIKARLNIHTNQNEEKIKKYWSNITGISLNNFGKSYIKTKGTGHRKKILLNGVITVRVNSEDLRHRIMTWIESIYQINA